jgi:formyltetrahydrofolate synthetase
VPVCHILGLLFVSKTHWKSASGLVPNCAVIVATIRALKMHGVSIGEKENLLMNECFCGYHY